MEMTDKNPNIQTSARAIAILLVVVAWCTMPKSLKWADTHAPRIGFPLLMDPPNLKPKGLPMLFPNVVRSHR